MANTLIQIEIVNSMLPDRYSGLKSKLGRLLLFNTFFLGGYFGFFKGRNATKLNSYYTINNGRFDQNKNGQIYEMNGAQKLPET